jgi:hypothetical protein
MTALLVGDSQIPTSLLPLGSVRCNSSPSFCAKLGEDMSELVPQRSIDFRGILSQPRVERNQFLAIISASGGGFETGIPFNAKLCCDSFRA